jgi:hypothetical protein
LTLEPPAAYRRIRDIIDFVLRAANVDLVFADHFLVAWYPVHLLVVPAAHNRVAQVPAKFGRVIQASLL